MDWQMIKNLGYRIQNPLYSMTGICSFVFVAVGDHLSRY